MAVPGATKAAGGYCSLLVYAGRQLWLHSGLEGSLPACQPWNLNDFAKLLAMGWSRYT